MCIISVYYQCVLSVCIISVYYQCVFMSDRSAINFGYYLQNEEMYHR